MGALFGSTTFWTAVLSILATILGQKCGVDVPTSVAAAAPIAVGVKEAARRYGGSIERAAIERARADVDVARLMHGGTVPPDPLPDLSQTSRFASESIERAQERERMRKHLERSG